MKRLLSLLGIAAFLPFSAAWAQTAPPNEMGVSFGRVRIIARDVEAEKKIWVALGGSPMKIDGIDVLKFPGMFIFITQGVPIYNQAGGAGVTRMIKNFGRNNMPNWTVVPVNASNEGNVANHVILDHPAGSGVIEKLQAMGVRVVVNQASDNEPDDGDVFTTENMRIDNNQVEDQKAPVLANAIQFDLPRYSRKAFADWYARMFGIKQKGNGGQVPGLVRGLAYGQNVGAPDAPQPSRGHALDSIGFEVVNLEAFCKKLLDAGVIFEYNYSKTRYKSFASAGITDPWGTGIELTEGLNKF